ncbi:MAG: SUMF1/EgtB/PvdO family nonheme iron enzyme, partial [Kiritimatiellae bacterium]|nr:SUMF1/EgtB/PvdO family nonheme iron enzyme [Kiritimatiellia bacterium]
EVNIADVNAVIDAIISNRAIERADVNSDGEINIADVNTIIDLILFPLSASKTSTVNGVTFKMIAVKGGSFTMGATTEQDGDVQDNEKPAHKVNLSDYLIGETEVTQELWVAVMGSNPTPASFQGDPNRPVSGISWYDCQEFIAKLNELTGQSFRLPTEAEWEYAASGGNKTHGYKYAGSNDINEVAWYYSNSTYSSYYGTFPVATKLPNELGLYDMSGNALEWCQDWYGSYDGTEQRSAA